MATLGINIYVCLGDTIIAGTRSNEIQAGVDTIEISSPTSGIWKQHKNIRKDWSISTSFLCLANEDVQKLLQVGNTYTIQVVGQEGSSAEELLSGTAILTSCKITASVANLVQGSFVFDGNGELTSDQPVPPTPQNPEIAWSAASASATIGGTNTFPTLSNPHNLAITFASSDTSVATVDSSGVVTLVAAGSANISASFAGNEDYYASTVSYTLAVEAALPYDEQYLTFEALEAGTFTLSIPASIDTASLSRVAYSIDGGSTWVETNNSSSAVVITTPTIQKGGKVLWKGKSDSRSLSRYSDGTNSSNFSSSGNFLMYGNTKSLLFWDNLQDEPPSAGDSLYNYFFKELFLNCTTLQDIGNIILPINWNAYCFTGMFRGCTSITKTPIINNNGTGRRSACQEMFYGCTSLNEITCLVATAYVYLMFDNWAYGVSGTGQFYKNRLCTNFSSGASGIPSGWSVEDV